MIVSGSSQGEREYLKYVIKQIERYRSRVRFRILDELSLEKTLEQVSNLKRESIVLLISFAFDSQGQSLPNDGARKLIEQASSVPVFGLVGRDLGYGLVGGPVPALEERYLLAADVASRILRGEPAEKIPVQMAVPKYAMAFDWRQLRHWGIDERRLPAHSLVLFRPPSLWETHPWLITGSSSALLIQLSLIIGFWIQRRRRMVTERALESSRNATAALAGKLVVAEEEERKRIARELHDDFGQQLALIGFQVASLKRQSAGLLEDENMIPRLQNDLRKLNSGLHNIAHQLHPRTFEALGIGASLANLIEDFRERTSIKVEFHDDSGEVVTSDAALCLFRVAQEALRNIERHSLASHARVTLRREFDFLALLIEDFGTGFDVEAAKRGTGLGLTSISERIRLVNGSLGIESREGLGTSLLVRVPYRPTIERTTGKEDAVSGSTT